ncbi:hypothetical protein GCM10023168_37120 [Fodinibacter luteus]|uniref:Integral membrane protein n=1 Tax=Fodinibacter luteus TaxID=552064 RepID=A0ABP8KR10_9MICO
MSRAPEAPDASVPETTAPDATAAEATPRGATAPESTAAEVTQPLTVDERAELERLRALVASEPAAPAPTRHPQRGRWAGAVVLMLLAALIAPLSALATWSNATLLDTDEYVAMVAPLAEDPAVQEEISRRITDAVFEQLRVEELTASTLGALAERPRVEGLTQNLPVDLTTFAQPISNAIYGFTEEQVSKLVASDAFEDAWIAANREAHASLVAALTGETSAGLTVEDGRVAVNLAAFIDAIKPVLIERGVPFADRIPTVNAQFVVLDSANLANAQSAIRLLDLLHTVLPIAAVLLLAAGVALAPARRRALVIGASMVVGSLVLLLLGVQVLRALYLDDIEQALLVPEVGQVLFDTVTVPLRLWVRSAAVLFLVIAVAAWLAGPSSAARAVRTVPARIAGSTRRPTGALASVARFAHHNVTGLRAAVGGLAVLAVLVGDRPSAGDVVVIAVVVAVALTVIEVFRRWGAQVEEADADAGGIAAPGADDSTAALPVKG